MVITNDVAVPSDKTVTQLAVANRGDVVVVVVVATLVRSGRSHFISIELSGNLRGS